MGIKVSCSPATTSARLTPSASRPVWTRDRGVLPDGKEAVIRQLQAAGKVACG